LPPPVRDTLPRRQTDIVVDGENSFLMQPDDVKQPSDRLRLLAGNAELGERMKQTARQRAETYCDAHRNAGRIVTCLLEIAGEFVDRSDEM
jgi:hypothetical protein